MSNDTETTPTTPKNINDNKFRIPLYQRPYAWEREQVKQLLDDLLVSSRKEGEPKYYIGILSVAETEDSNMYDLIDGQQRITTLMLIGKAAKKHYDEWNKFLGTKGNRRLILYGRNQDEAFLLGDNTESSNIKMKIAFETANAFFESMKDRDKQESFSKYIYENAAFFLSEMPKKYTLIDKNKHFVRMNNRGKQLEKHEILKVNLIGKSDTTKQADYFAEWNIMVELLKDIPAENTEDENNNSTGKEVQIKDAMTLSSVLKDTVTRQKPTTREPLNWAITTIPEFLLIALARYLKKPDISHVPAKLIETFYGHPKLNIDDFMVVLNEQVKLLSNYFIFISKGNHGYSLGKKQSNNSGEDQSGFDIKDRDYGKNKKRLVDIQSFLHVSTEPHHWLIDAFNWLASQNKVVVSDFVKHLELIDNTLITNKKRELKPSWNDQINVGDMTYGNVSYYWFYRLDYELLKVWNEISTGNPWGDTSVYKEISEKIKAFRFRKCNSIEHIIPQSPEVINDKTKELPDNSFGNLALIQGEMNSRLKNYNIGGKIDLILKSEIQSLKMVHFLWGGYAKSKDTKTEGEKLFEFLKNKVKDGTEKLQNDELPVA